MLYFWICLTFVLFAIGTPIGFGLGAGASVAALLELGVSPAALASRVFESINAFTLLAVPLFIFAGNLMVHGGSSKFLIDFINSFIRQFRGGLGIVVIVSCGFFATLCGSGIATAAAMATIMFPLMASSGYSQRLSTGTIAIGSTLGPIIPPSIWMILYGPMAETDVAHMFVAGFFPGIILIILFIPVVRVLAVRGKVPLLPPAGWGERGRSVFKALPVIFMPILVLGGIYGGIFTPTEAAVIAAVYALIIGAIVYRQLKIQPFLTACRDAIRTTAAVFIIIIGATLFGFVVAQAGIPKAVTDGIIGAGVPPLGFLLIVSVLYIFLGMFMGALAILLVFTPFFLPTVALMGIDPIHFGILVVTTLCLAEVSPPFGAAVFTISSITNVKSEEIFRGAWPLIVVEIAVIFLIAAVPQISLFLPALLGFK